LLAYDKDKIRHQLSPGTDLFLYSFMIIVIGQFFYNFSQFIF